MSLTNDDWRRWLNTFEIRQKAARDKKLVTRFDPLNADLPLPDDISEQGQKLADEIAKEAAKALVGFAKGNRWPEGQ